MIPTTNRHAASPSSTAAAALRFVLILSFATVLPAAVAQNSQTQQCVQETRAQLRSYVRCVYGLDAKDRDNEKNRLKNCWPASGGQKKDTAAARGPSAPKEKEKKAMKGESKKGVTEDKMGASKSNKDMAAKPKGMDEHEIRRLRPEQRSLQRGGKKGESEVSEARDCLQNFDEDIADSTVELCLSWGYDEASCFKLCYVTTKLSDDADSVSMAEGESGSKCDQSSVCSGGLFCAIECYNGIGCTEGEVAVGNGYCQACVQCEMDFDVFVVDEPPQDGVGCASVCQSGNQIGRSISDDASLSMFVDLVDTVQEYQWYAPTQPITLFAPENRAIERIDNDYKETFEKYFGDAAVWTPQLNDILESHTLPAKYTSTALAGMVGTAGIPSLNGHDMLTFEKNKDKIEVNGAKVERADIEAAGESSNVAIHVIDKVLLPASIKENLFDIIMTRPEFEALAAIILESLSKEDGKILKDLLASDGPLTFFAPTEEALSYFHPVDFRDDVDVSALFLDVLMAHAVPLNVHSRSIVGPMSEAETLLEGAALTLRKQGNGNVKVTRESQSAMVITPNIVASNGIMHTINMVLVPSSLNPI